MSTKLAAMQAALLGLLLSACGGGGGDGASNVPLANAPPAASFTATPSSGTTPLTVQFDASASTDSDGSIASYSWNFGDSSAAGAGVTTSHAFQATGTYVVTLTVTDNRGATATTTRQILISPPTDQTPKLSKIATIDNGDMTVCAVGTDGKAWCWGSNNYGQLGTGNTTNSAVPVAASGGLNFASITTHQMVSCGITTDGVGYCWGNGSEGNLGGGSRSSSNVPVAVKGGLRFSFLQLGLWTACGVTTTGEGYCWGSNGSGELGIGSKTPAEALEPFKVAGDYRWKSMAPGVAVTCGVTVDGRGLCWGGNAWGERGDGPFPASDVTAPLPVVGDLTFDSIDADWCSCGVASNVAYCWGPGSEGCIGDGAKVNRGVPTRVAGQP